MREGWKMTHLKDVSEIMYGYTAKASLENEGPKYLRITDIQENSVDWAKVPQCEISENELSKYQLLPNDIVFARTGATTGKSFLITSSPEAVFASYLIRVQLTNGILLPEFLYLYFSSPAYWSIISKGISGSAQGGFNAKKLGDLKIPIPTLPEQQEIIKFLKRAFVIIDKAKAKLEQNLSNAQELFQSKLDAVFSQRGEGWEEKKLGDVCQLINGRAYKKSELLIEGKYPVLRVGNFFTNRNWYYSELELEENKYCDNGDLLYAWSASFGPRIWEGDKAIYHYHIWKVEPDYSQVTKEFLFMLFEWDTEKIKLAHGTGTTMIHVSKGSMEKRKLPIPPLTRQKEITDTISELKELQNDLIQSYKQKLNNLEALKKSLFQKAFSGELINKEMEV